MLKKSTKKNDPMRAWKPKATRKTAAGKKAPVARRQRQDRLPGVETDPGSMAIDNAAYAYVEARDAMQEATKFVHKQEEKLLAVLKKERPGKKAYKHEVGGETITIQIIAKDPTEKAKVKIQAEDGKAADDSTDAAAEDSVSEPPEVYRPETDDDPF